MHRQTLKRKRAPQLRLLAPWLLLPCVQPARGATTFLTLFHILHANITCVFLVFP